MINKQVANIPWYAEFEFESMNEFLQWKINQCILSLDCYFVKPFLIGFMKFFYFFLKISKNGQKVKQKGV